ncbi:MAG: hypothetical protein ACOC36_02020 [Fibrobacterota bacterium]
MYRYTRLWILGILLATGIEILWACQLPAIQITSMDTLQKEPDLIVERTFTSYLSDTTFIDTVSRSEMISEMVSRYNASSYVFITTTDTCASYSLEADTTDEGYILLPHTRDSIVVSIEEVLKTAGPEMHDGKIFTIVRNSFLLENRSYRYLCRQRMLIFTEDISSYTTTFPQQPYCGTVEGFFIGENEEIVHKDYYGVSTTLEMFQAALETTPVAQKKTAVKSSGKKVRMINGTVTFTLPGNSSESVKIEAFHLSGRKVKQWVADQKNGTVLLPAGKQLVGGVYVFELKGMESGEVHRFNCLISR